MHNPFPVENVLYSPLMLAQSEGRDLKAAAAAGVMFQECLIGVLSPCLQSEGGDLEAAAAAAAGGNAEAAKHLFEKCYMIFLSLCLHRVRAVTWRQPLLLLEATHRPQNTCSKNAVHDPSPFPCLHRVRAETWRRLLLLLEAMRRPQNIIRKMSYTIHLPFLMHCTE